MKNKPLLEYKNISKSYGSKTVLSEINLTVPHGRIVGLLGQNGAGKSTLIKLANDLLQPTRGRVLVNGQPVGIESKKIISYLPERTYLDKTMRIREAIRMFAEFYADFDTARAAQLLSAFQLTDDLQISKISKGMQEKLQLALVMSRRAKLYILDEPLGGIDPATRDDVLDIILDNFDTNASMLISTHLISDVERILDEVHFLAHGKILLSDSADQLRARENKSIDAVFRAMFKNKKGK